MTSNAELLPDFKTYYKTRTRKAGDPYISVAWHEQRDNPQAPWVVEILNGTWGKPRPEPKIYPFTTFNEAQQAFTRHCEKAQREYPVNEKDNPTAFLERY